MKTWTYNIVISSIPKGVDPLYFRREVARAMRYVEKASGNRVKFYEAKSAGGSHVTIGFASLQMGRVAEHLIENSVNSIAFDLHTKWHSKFWHNFIGFRPRFYVLAVHELGHLLGLSHNTDERIDSAMSPNPRFGKFSPQEIETLKRLLA